MTISSTIDPKIFGQTVSHFGEVGGYLSKRAAEVFFLINLFQREKDIHGDILEIGSYEGRSTIFLTHLLSEEEVLHVSDLFDRQDLNISHSLGVGFAPWERNFEKFKKGNPGVEIHRGPSQELSPGELGKSFRLAYLDGGHSTEEVVSDLALADAILIDDGVAFLDDTFRDDFPGTTEGLVEFVNEGGGLVPVLCFETKVALVRPHLHEACKAMLLERTDTGESILLAPQRLCGWAVLTMRFRGDWEMASLRLQSRLPLLHKTLASTPLVGRLFHRARGS